MSLGYHEPEQLKVTCGATCSICGNEKTITVYEGDENDDNINAHVCQNCSDPITFEKYYSLLLPYYGCFYDLEAVKSFYADFLSENMHGKAISIYEHIQNLNLNDTK